MKLLIELLLIFFYSLMFVAIMATFVILPAFFFQMAWNFVIVDFGAPSLTFMKALVLFWMWILVIRPTVLSRLGW